jgi:hypothetical protein
MYLQRNMSWPMWLENISKAYLHQKIEEAQSDGLFVENPGKGFRH